MADAIVKKDEQKTFSMVAMEKLESISDALPKDLNKTRFIQNAMALVSDKPDIMKYGQGKILNGLVRGAMLGLDFYNREAYLVPYGQELQYQTSYIGQQKLIKKYSLRPVKEIYAEIVREDDFFETGIENNKRFVTFKPKPFNNKPVVGAFAVARFVDGDVLVETMNLEELEAVRKASKMGNAGAWKLWTGEMQKKSVIRRLCKKIEIDFETPEQKQIFEADTDIETDPVEIRNNEVNESANSVDFEPQTIDGEAKEVPFA